MCVCVCCRSRYVLTRTSPPRRSRGANCGSLRLIAAHCGSLRLIAACCGSLLLIAGIGACCAANGLCLLAHSPPSQQPHLIAKLKAGRDGPGDPGRAGPGRAGPGPSRSRTVRKRWIGAAVHGRRPWAWAGARACARAVARKGAGKGMDAEQAPGSLRLIAAYCGLLRLIARLRLVAACCGLLRPFARLRAKAQAKACMQSRHGPCCTGAGAAVRPLRRHATISDQRRRSRLCRRAVRGRA